MYQVMWEKPEISAWLSIVAAIGAFVFFAALVIRLVRRYDRVAERRIQAMFEGLATDSPDDMVTFKFHTYCGVIVWVNQKEHTCTLPRDSALVLLNRLLRFNLTWGMTNAFLLFVPIISGVEYLQAKRAIARRDVA